MVDHLERIGIVGGAEDCRYYCQPPIDGVDGLVVHEERLEIGGRPEDFRYYCRSRIDGVAVWLFMRREDRDCGKS